MILLLSVILLASCSYRGEEAAVTSSELTVTPVYKSRVVAANQQAPELSVATNSEGTAILWSGVSTQRSGVVGVAGMDGEGILSYRRMLIHPVEFEQTVGTSAQAEDNPARPVAINVIDSNTSVIALSHVVPSSEPRERLEVELHVLSDGMFLGTSISIDDADISKADRIYFVGEGDDRFSLFWEGPQSVKRQSFELAQAKSAAGGGQVIKAVTKVATVAKRERLAAVDEDGNLYFLNLRSAKGVGNLSISVSKTDRDGEVIFDDLVVAKRAPLGPGFIKWPRVIAGPSSFAVTWGSTKLQQVSGSGELLGEAVELKKRGPGGVRIMKTHGETIIDDMYASTRRQLKPLLGSRELGRSKLEKLIKKKEPLFEGIGDQENNDLLQAAISFIDRSAKTPNGVNFSHGIEDRSGNNLDADMSLVSTDTVMIKLRDPKPMIMIDIYRGGRLLKTINLGRGEDVALAAHDDDLIATWTGGDGFVDLRIARWRLRAKGN